MKKLLFILMFVLLLTLSSCKDEDKTQVEESLPSEGDTPSFVPEENYYTVNFYFEDLLIDSYHVKEGEGIVEPIFDWENYQVEFIGWDSYDFQNVIGDLDIHAIVKPLIEENYYTVNFYFEDFLIYSYQVKEGEGVIEPMFDWESYQVEFIGWDSYDFQNVIGDLDIHAIVKPLVEEIYVDFCLDGYLIEQAIYKNIEELSLPDIEPKKGYRIEWNLEELKEVGKTHYTINGNSILLEYQAHIYFDNEFKTTKTYTINSLLDDDDLLRLYNKYAAIKIDLSSLPFFIKDYDKLSDMYCSNLEITINMS